ncbi:hypothetical protein Scep_023362 [Stephania cephalantha]|uniref:Uncharacterized protein n=1 Tax=Stephania cephalantha TaxID=152367 RepID=A0AAP0EZX9_9MAGN
MAEDKLVETTKGSGTLTSRLIWCRAAISPWRVLLESIASGVAGVDVTCSSVESEFNLHSVCEARYEN